MPYRALDRRDEPPPKRQRRNPSFPEIDTRYVLGSHKPAPQGNGDDPATPHPASVSFGDGYFSQYNSQNRMLDSPSKTYQGQARREYSQADSNQYPTPDSQRTYPGHGSNRLSMGSEMTMAFGGLTEPGRHHYSSSAESQTSIPAAPTAMHPPILGTSRASASNDTRPWPGSLETSGSYPAYHHRGASGSALPTGHLLPAPINFQSRSSVDNYMQSM